MTVFPIWKETRKGYLGAHVSKRTRDSEEMATGGRLGVRDQKLELALGWWGRGLRAQELK